MNIDKIGNRAVIIKWLKKSAFYSENKYHKTIIELEGCDELSVKAILQLQTLFDKIRHKCNRQITKALFKVGVDIS